MASVVNVWFRFSTQDRFSRLLLALSIASSRRARQMDRLFFSSSLPVLGVSSWLRIFFFAEGSTAGSFPIW